MENVRLGIIGLGGMGLHHFKSMDGVVGARVTAVCDMHPGRLKLALDKSPELRAFDRWEQMLESGAVDAVLIATPHYLHPPISVAAIERGIHVLTEKPVAVTVGAAAQVNEVAARHPRIKYAAMFQQRTWPGPRKLYEIVRGGELGEITRLTWIATDWFRPWSYYASGNWRATWKGEGGGVLINQCPHNLDLICWIAGMMPKRVTAIAHVGKTHPIETEDEVSAILEYDNGATGHLITTTGEAPGTNLLEIAGDRGLVRMETGKLRIRRTKQSVREFRETSPGPFSLPELEETEVALDPPHEFSHRTLVQNFVNAIVTDEPLIAPAVEGIKGLELGNAMLLSGLTRQPVELPLDARRFDDFLEELARQYAGRKIPAKGAAQPVQPRF
jgi:predicted dehydrogenase